MISLLIFALKMYLFVKLNLQSIQIILTLSNALINITILSMKLKDQSLGLLVSYVVFGEAWMEGVRFMRKSLLVKNSIL